MPTVGARSLGAYGGSEPDALERRPDDLDLFVRSSHERQAQAADLVAEQVQRGFHGNRVDRHAERVDQRLELVVDPPRTFAVARGDAAARAA